MCTFGSSADIGMTNDYVENTIKLGNGLDRNYDCFYDQDQQMKLFFDQILSITSENDIFAVLPNGRIEKYNISQDFEEWLNGLYSIYVE